MRQLLQWAPLLWESLHPVEAVLVVGFIGLAAYVGVRALGACYDLLESSAATTRDAREVAVELGTRDH